MIRQFFDTYSNNKGKEMGKSVTLRLEENIYDEFCEAAAAEQRPVFNLIEVAALARIREAQFVDDMEAAEILNNDALIERMRNGSKQARQGKGKLVA